MATQARRHHPRQPDVHLRGVGRGVLIVGDDQRGTIVGHRWPVGRHHGPRPDQRHHRTTGSDRRSDPTTGRLAILRRWPRLRHAHRAARLHQPGFGVGRAGPRPTPGHRARRTDRSAGGQSRRTRRVRGADDPRRVRRRHRTQHPVRSGVVGSSRRRRQHTTHLRNRCRHLRQPRSAAHHPGWASRARPRRRRTGRGLCRPRPSTARPRRHRDDGPRPRTAAASVAAGSAVVRRLLVRHGDRSGLPRALPGSGPGARPRWRCPTRLGSRSHARRAGERLRPGRRRDLRSLRCEPDLSGPRQPGDL